jgi:hypothetical protein
MGHFARINGANVVVQVIVAEQDVIDSGAFGEPSEWIRTSYNTQQGIHWKPGVSPHEPSEDQSKALRKNYASAGDTYDRERDAFIGPKPYPSWVLDEFSCIWKAPVTKPVETDPNTAYYYWDEETTSWLLHTIGS